MWGLRFRGLGVLAGSKECKFEGLEGLKLEGLRIWLVEPRSLFSSDVFLRDLGEPADACKWLAISMLL